MKYVCPCGFEYDPEVGDPDAGIAPGTAFEDIPDADSAFTRPEFIKISKKSEVEMFASSAYDGLVRDVCFRGTHIELRILMHDSEIVATRRLDESPVEIGETVNVFCIGFL